MSQNKQGRRDSEETLLNNAGAIRAICAAVEGTLGPKGLDTMLVGDDGEVIITNDGVTILEKMDVSHPAARLLIQVARSQQQEIGDGTTTATVLAGALVEEGVARVVKGVPVAKVVKGMEEGVEAAARSLALRAKSLSGASDPLVQHIAYTAAREQGDIARLVAQAAVLIGTDALRHPDFKFADTVSAHEKAANEVWPGLLLQRKPADPFGLPQRDNCRILVMFDALEPETVEEEALTTETGFRRRMELKERFRTDLERLAELEVGLIALDRGADREAEQFCSDHGIVLLSRVSRTELQRLCAATGAKPLKRTALTKPANALAAALGVVDSLSYDARLECVRIGCTGARPVVSVLVGAATREIVGERARIARDAAAAVQAAVRGGIVPGGGAVEMAVAHELERIKETAPGLESHGLQTVADALRRPLAQMAVNAGFNPLEKVELVKAAQLAAASDSLGVDCDSGELIDCAARGIFDPAPVKIHALRAAAEVAAAVMRIHTVIKMGIARRD